MLVCVVVCVVSLGIGAAVSGVGGGVVGSVGAGGVACSGGGGVWPGIGCAAAADATRASVASDAIRSFILLPPLSCSWPAPVGSQAAQTHTGEKLFEPAP